MAADVETSKGKTLYLREFRNEFPCVRDCPDRHMACHTDCIKYKKAKEDNDKKKAEIRAKKDAEGAVSEYISRRVSETTRKPIKQR